MAIEAMGASSALPGNLISGPVKMEGKLALQLLEAAAATAPQTLASPPPAPSADDQLGTNIDVEV